jgi:NADPH2:quinone reductase
MHIHKGEWAEAMPVSGIECVCIVDARPGGELAVGGKVAVLMGGMGRMLSSRTHLQRLCAILRTIFQQLSALPYAAARTCLFRNFEIKKGQSVEITW